MARRLVHYGFLLSAAMAVVSPAPALAISTLELSEQLPWLKDPLDAEKKIEPYTSTLRPSACPTIPTENHTYTLDEVVVLALCNNPSTKTTYLSQMQDAYSYAQSYADYYFPEVSVTADWAADRNFEKLKKTDPSITRESGYTASLGMTLFDFGQREMTLDIAERSLAIAGFGHSSTLQGVIGQALSAYYSLLTAQNSVIAAEESEQLAKASFEAANLKYEIGQVALADRLSAKSSYSSAILSTQSAHNSLATTKASLARLMGLPPDETVKVAELDDTNLKLEPFDGKLPELMAEAKKKRVDLQSARLSLENSKTSLRKTTRSNWATVSAGVNAEFTKDRLYPLSRGTANEQTIGLSVSIPLFPGFNQMYEERKAKLSLEAAEESLASTELSVEQDVWNAWHNYQTALKSWETSQDFVKSATEFKDVALGRYKEGIGTILDVLSAQTQYNSALQSQLQTRYNLLTTRIDLVRAVGVLDLQTMRPEANIELPPAEDATATPMETVPAPQ